MKTTLKIQLLDSSEDGCFCFGDIMTTPYGTPEELFTAVFGTENIGVPAHDIRTGLDENSNPQIEIDFFQEKCYDSAYYNGLECCNKITRFLEKTLRNLSSVQQRYEEHEITDDEVESIMNGEVINAGTNTPKETISFKVDDDINDDLEEEENLHNLLKLNIDAQEILKSLCDLIIHLKDEETFNYIFQLMITEGIQIENDLLEHELSQ